MKEHPILFNGEMVRAILAGRKRQTRRPVKPQPQINKHSVVVGPSKWTPSGEYLWDVTRWQEVAARYHCPYGAPGDRLWVRETWAAVWPDLEKVPLEECNIEYRADLPSGCDDYPGGWPADEARGNPDAPKWRPSIHMPRGACRLMLEVTDVRAERLQKITPEDAIAEGIFDVGDGGWSYEGAKESRVWHYPAYAFAAEWDAIYWVDKDLGWDDNPWVWVIEFEPQQVKPRSYQLYEVEWKGDEGR